MRRIDCHNHVGVEMQSYLRGNYPYAQMLTQLMNEGRSAGITDWVVFPMVTNLALSLERMRCGEISAEDFNLESVPYAWENRRLMEEVYIVFPESARNVYPFVMADPARNVEAQAQALRRLSSEFRFYGLKFQTTILQSPIKSLLTTGRVFLDLAAEWNLPLLIHSSVYPEDTWAQASDIIDIAEIFPNLRFCVAHSCRFDKVQLDRIAALPNTWFDCSAHRIHCQLAQADSPHIARASRRFASNYTRPESVLSDLSQAYPGKMLWGSDSPYQSFAEKDGLSLFSSYTAEADCLNALPEPLQQEVAWENTRRCFGLPLGANPS